MASELIVTYRLIVILLKSREPNLLKVCIDFDWGFSIVSRRCMTSDLRCYHKAHKLITGKLDEPPSEKSQLFFYPWLMGFANCRTLRTPMLNYLIKTIGIKIMYIRVQKRSINTHVSPCVECRLVMQR